MFNLSIDPPDLLKNIDSDVFLEEDLSVNEMESVTELILEQALDLENAVPESDDSDSDTQFKKVEIFSPTPSNIVYIFIPVYKHIKPQTPYFSSFFRQSYPDIIAPPPKA